ALPDVLVDPVALAGDEPLASVPDLVVGLRVVRAGGPHRGRHSDEQITLARQRYAQRIHVTRRRPAGHDRWGGDQGGARAWNRRARGRDGRRRLTGSPHRRIRQIWYGAEAPA